jgi:gamma-butyrobetaine dioxygenase
MSPNPEHIRPIPALRPTITLPPDTTHSLEKRNSSLSIEIDSQRYSYDTLFLRDLCPCPKCIDPDTRQKLFNTTDIPIDIVPRAMRVKQNGLLEIIWNHPENHPHVSHYDPDLLLRYSTLEKRKHFRFPLPKQVYWDGEMMRENLLRVDYETFLKDEVMLHKVLMQLHLYGLALFVNVPSKETEGLEVTNLATRFGEVKQTFYGKTWDVKSVPQSKNIAYPP